MVTFFHDLLQRLQGTDGRRTTDGTRTAPYRRRRNARLHRLLAVVCAGLAMFAALQCVRLTISTQPVVIAAQTIAKGSVITADSLALRDLPYDEALRNVFQDCDDAVGLIAQVDVAEGDTGNITGYGCRDIARTMLGRDPDRKTLARCGRQHPCGVCHASS